jgi:hypothetical protein
MIFTDTNVRDTSVAFSMDQYSEGMYRWTIQAFTSQSTDTSRRSGLAGSSRFTLQKTPESPAGPTVVPAVATVGAGMFPPNNYIYNAERLRGISSITFRWGAVEGAAGYTFTLFRGDGGQIISRKIGSPAFDLQDLSVLSRGSFTWQAAAVGSNGSEIRGSAVRYRFTVDIPEVQRTKVEDMGTLYGN